MSNTQQALPTKQEILKDFSTWVRKGSDKTFQFERAVRRWLACGYSAAELPHLFSCPPSELVSAIEKAAVA